MKTSTLLYLVGAALAVVVAVLRMTHVLAGPGSYVIISVIFAMGIWANTLRLREIKKGLQ